MNPVRGVAAACAAMLPLWPAVAHAAEPLQALSAQHDFVVDGRTCTITLEAVVEERSAHVTAAIQPDVKKCQPSLNWIEVEYHDLAGARHLVSSYGDGQHQFVNLDDVDHIDRSYHYIVFSACSCETEYELRAK